MTEIETKLFAIADQVRETAPDAARAILALVVALREWSAWQQAEWYKRHGEILQKWNDFSNTCIREEFDRQSQLVEQERARILRALAVDPRWNGSYADLVKAVK